MVIERNNKVHMIHLMPIIPLDSQSYKVTLFLVKGRIISWDWVNRVTYDELKAN